MSKLFQDLVMPITTTKGCTESHYKCTEKSQNLQANEKAKDPSSPEPIFYCSRSLSDYWTD